MYSIKDVSKYVINYANDNGFGITNMQLQKILYFLYGYYFMVEGEELFDAEFEAWAYGPAISKIYTDYSMYGGDSIPPHNNYLNLLFNKGEVYNRELNSKYYSNLFKESDILIINLILDKLLSINPYHLVEVSHIEAGPWKARYKASEKNKINKKEIQRYFSKKV